MKNCAIFNSLIFYFFIFYLVHPAFALADFVEYIEQKNRDKLEQIEWNNPRLEDLKLLQEIYDEECDNFMSYFDTYDKQGNPVQNHRRSRYKNFKFYSEELTEVPKFELVKIGNANTEKKCIVLYCGLNGPWKNCIPDLIETLKNIGYNGDVLYQISGWPYLKNDSLKAFLTPYGFKPCACMEAMERGYELVLWLDTVLVPTANIHKVFEILSKHDIFIYDDCISYNTAFYKYKLCYHSDFLTEYYKITPKKLTKLNHLNTAVVGFNFRKEKTHQLVSQWFQMSKDFLPFLFATPDQLPFSILAYKLGIDYYLIPNHLRADTFVLHPIYGHQR